MDCAQPDGAGYYADGAAVSDTETVFADEHKAWYRVGIYHLADSDNAVASARLYQRIPVQLEEAASIDGCGTLRMFAVILLPNILPGVLTAAIFAFIGAWNEFFFALCFMKSPENMTLSMTLYTYIGLSGQSRDGMLAAASLFSSLPGIILFGFFQKYYVSGMTEGAVK